MPRKATDTPIDTEELLARAAAVLDEAQDISHSGSQVDEPVAEPEPCSSEDAPLSPQERYEQLRLVGVPKSRIVVTTNSRGELTAVEVLGG